MQEAMELRASFLYFSVKHPSEHSLKCFVKQSVELSMGTSFFFLSKFQF